MDDGICRQEIEKVIGRSLNSEAGRHNLSSLPAQCILESNELAAESTLLAMFYLRHCTNSFIAEVKEYAGSMGWAVGNVFE